MMMFRKILFRTMILPFVVVLSWTAIDGLSAATALPLLSLQASQVTGNQKEVQLVAQLPGTTKTVQFYVYLTQFKGQYGGKGPLLLIGSSKTNASGVAEITYKPTWTGTLYFRAQISSGPATNGQTQGANDITSDAGTHATTSLLVGAANTPFKGAIEAVRPVGVVGQWVALVLLIVVIAIWITLIVTVIRVNRGLSETQSFGKVGLGGLSE